MLKAVAKLPDGRKLLLLGIDNGNIKRLKKKMPLMVEVDDHIPGIGLRLGISWARTLGELEAEWSQFTNAQTKVHYDDKVYEIMDGEEPTKVVIEIEMKNAAFEGDPTPEVTRILAQACSKIAEQLEREPTICTAPEASDKLLDINGNTVGSVRVE